MLKSTISIVQIFPDFEERIDFLFQADEMFRDLCTDYILCASKVLEMKKEKRKNKSQIEEYEELQKDLEQEILQMISKNRDRSGA